MKLHTMKKYEGGVQKCPLKEAHKLIKLSRSLGVLPELLEIVLLIFLANLIFFLIFNLARTVQMSQVRVK